MEKSGMLRGILALAVLVAVNVASAKPRDMGDMKSIAREALDVYEKVRRVKGMQEIGLLDKRDGLYVMGYPNGGYAIIAGDDNFDAVLGLSESKYNARSSNSNFLYWLNAVEEMTSKPPSEPLPIIKPDTCRFPESVEPLLKTKWGQSSPYNMYCPNGTPTGCVATAAAQVLKYNQWPATGNGKAFVYFPFGDFDGEKYEMDGGWGEFDYDNMLDIYGHSLRENQQTKDAVAALMYGVGLAMKAQYDNSGTGSYNETLCHGLRRNLNYPFAVTVNSDSYTAQEWMDKIFECISNRIPLVYGGSDKSYAGHEFVLHGYNKSGKVYINWGWEGSDDGYFDIAQLILYWGLYDFSRYQDMVLRCTPQNTSTDKVEVEVVQPGTLSQLLTPEQLDTTVWLGVTGKVNSTDILTLRRMAGAGQLGEGVWGNLSYLDLEKAEITEGGEPYLIEGGVEYTTQDGVMPRKAFADCCFLVDVVLPRNLSKYEDGVFAGCLNLDNVEIQAGPDAGFVVDSNFVMTSDRKELIEWIPGYNDQVHIVVPDGVTKIHDYALAGRCLYERLTIPESVETIGEYAFNRCFDLSRTYMMSATPPVIDETAIDPLDISLRNLYVPLGAKSAYMNAIGWKKYGSSRIKEYQADGVGDMVVDNNASEVGNVYGIGGQCLGIGTTGSKGFYISGGRKILVK